MGIKMIYYLGHVMGQERIWPMQDNISNIKDEPRSVTKEHFRSFLSLSGYYKE